MAFMEGLRETFRLPDLRRRILITLLILVLYRLAANIPVPGVDHDSLKQALSGQGGFTNVLDLLSGGAVANFSVLAMGVNPYITASIILQIMTPLVPALEQLTKEGQAGRDKLNRYTMYASIPMALLQAWGLIIVLQNPQANRPLIPGFGSDLILTTTVLTAMTAGTMFAIWLGELITEDGIGNGLSLIIFSGIVARVPYSMNRIFLTDTGSMIRNLALFVGLTLITLVVIVVVQEGQRRIPIKYGKRVRGTKMYGGGTAYLPLRVNTAGMIPLIFAQTLLSFPALVAGFFAGSQNNFVAGFARSTQELLGNQGGNNVSAQTLYWGIYFLIVAAITYIYTEIMIRNQNLADNLQHHGGFILGIRPGKRTEEFINRVVNRITLVGALFLGFVAIMPGVVEIIANVLRAGAATEVRGALFVVSGGGLIIVVNVIIETMRQLEAQLVMRHRDTFIR